ncbi:MAG: glycosyltransferase family 4 protein [Pyrinomonadaceae bacterium]
MKVLAVVPGLYDTSPGQRFRIEQWEPHLKEKGVDITYSPFETEELRSVLYKNGHAAQKFGAVLKNMNRRRKGLDSVGDYDLVYVFREAALMGPAWFEKKIARSGVPMVFDFDDAVFVAYKSPSNGYLSYLKFPGKTADTVRLSAHVMAGNPYLAEYSRRYNQNVTVIPTTIDTDIYIPATKNGGRQSLTIGWSGSHSTIQHLDTVRETLQQLATEEKFKLRVIGTSEYELDGVEVEVIQWRSESETQDLQPIDIGIMPLPDDEWSKGKCGLKALQYMALGIPTICSPVGVNSDIIQDGENGFLADGKDEWISKLKEMIRSPDLRQRIGSAGRITVEERYSARSQAPRVLEIFEKVSRGR